MVRYILPAESDADRVIVRHYELDRADEFHIRHNKQKVFVAINSKRNGELTSSVDKNRGVLAEFRKDQNGDENSQEKYHAVLNQGPILPPPFRPGELPFGMDRRMMIDALNCCLASYKGMHYRPVAIGGEGAHYAHHITTCPSGFLTALH